MNPTYYQQADKCLVVLFYELNNVKIVSRSGVDNLGSEII